MMENQSYQSIREQLINLQVDLDDKDKICSVLENRINIERSKLGRIEADATGEYTAILEAEFESGQQETERLKAFSVKLVEEKRQYVKQCQELVDGIKEKERDLAAERRRVHREASEKLDLERKQFRAGHNQRLANFLASKTQEHKESTGKALQPEFARLEKMHEREMSDLEARSAVNERRVREEYQQRLESMLRDERDMHQESQRNIGRNVTSAVSAELQGVEREHKMRMASQRRELEQDMERLRQHLSQKLNKERQNGQTEVQKTQEMFQQRLHGLRSQHQSEMNAIMRNHEEQCRQVDEAANNARRAVEKKVKQEGDDGATSMLDTEETVEFNRTLMAERDKRLQSEIRHLQAESVRLERGWKQKAEEEQDHIQDSREKEEKESKRRQRQLTEEISELAVDRESRKKVLTISQQQLDVVIGDLQSVQKEIDVYRSGISVHRMRIRDIQTSYNARTSDEQRGNASKIDAIKGRIAKLRQQAKVKTTALARELAALETLHVGEMEKLDRAVKVDVSKKDADLEMLRDAVATERVKVNRLEKLLQESSVDAHKANKNKGR